ncbi:MAG: DEAD/DEAH box helicase family protein [Nitrospira sp.]|nr:DEAD/DEAH box helicase family protein [Nitrospira sp.]MDE0486862.1 DEAD/DEAH box helicase family protein [Nitrospira sp.]
MSSRRRLVGTSLLQNRLVLHRFICQEFGYDGMRAMLERLRDVLAGFDVGVESEYARALYLSSAAPVRTEELARYDANIVAHSHKLRMTPEQGRVWKPYQYLALLFTERYLDRYFHDPEALCADLNRTRVAHRLTRDMPDYTLDDLRTIAFQSATGSGKTLLMHAHILQYRQYLADSGGRLNNVVLLTPNEQMSMQHEKELKASGLPARLFSAEAGADLFSHVEIIDLNKLAEKKGVKRIAVGDFGDNNLVLVDEGHLGASGKVWRERRKELSRGGFTFEYSATFNQIAGKDDVLRDAYGKCMLFDYSYRWFHEDGYGKDYVISNLPQGMEDMNRDVYLLGCLLTFYQQCRAWRDKSTAWADFNVTRPLWVFLGKTVTGSGKADKETQSDVVSILNFLARVLADGNAMRVMIRQLLDGQSGLTDESGRDYFRDRFIYLSEHVPAHSVDDLYTDLCVTLFHGLGKLHVVYLTAGEGELHLHAGDGPAFGVVNVGDSAALYKLLTEQDNPHVVVSREAGFAERLFADVDRRDSPVNIVIGARRFIAGWNSWRVATMGLMHVGVGEGPEIIQMFGRGVRLKGWNMSLKRHQKSGAELPTGSAELAHLETLNIFGLRANYMQTFRDILEKEGVRVERETVRLPVTWNFARKTGPSTMLRTGLKLIRLKEGVQYARSTERTVLPGPGAGQDVITLDLYSRLQSVASSGVVSEQSAAKRRFELPPDQVAFFNRTRLYDKLLKRKQQRGWHNLIIERDTVDRLLKCRDWYDLYMPPERLAVTGFSQIAALEDVALDLITEYADQFWRKQRRQWEHARIEVVTLDDEDPNNIKAYELSVDATERLLLEDVHELAANVRAGDFHNLNVSVIMTQAHAYKPLLYAGPDRKVTIQPVPLNKDERNVVEKLAALAERRDPCLHGKELFLIRNRTCGRGVSFFDDYAYYPDFIVWLKDEICQHVIFLDPKGLSRYGSRAQHKISLHHEIKKTEAQIRDSDPDVRLHAYILSVTPPALIDETVRSRDDWKQRGVYFLEEDDCLKQMIGHVLEQA